MEGIIGRGIQFNREPARQDSEEGKSEDDEIMAGNYDSQEVGNEATYPQPQSR